MKSALSLVLFVSACAHQAPPLPPRPPLPLAICPARPPVPAALPAVVSLDRLAEAYHNLDLARQAERSRGDLCAESLRKLHAWTQDTQLP